MTTNGRDVVAIRMRRGSTKERARAGTEGLLYKVPVGEEVLVKVDAGVSKTENVQIVRVKSLKISFQFGVGQIVGIMESDP